MLKNDTKRIFGKHTATSSISTHFRGISYMGHISCVGILAEFVYWCTKTVNWSLRTRDWEKINIKNNQMVWMVQFKCICSIFRFAKQPSTWRRGLFFTFWYLIFSFLAPVESLWFQTEIIGPCVVESWCPQIFSFLSLAPRKKRGLGKRLVQTSLSLHRLYFLIPSPTPL